MKFTTIASLFAATAALRVAPPQMSTAAATRVATERYIAMNRFRVKPGREASYEEGWADRKSQLGLREGSASSACCAARTADLRPRTT